MLYFQKKEKNKNYNFQILATGIVAKACKQIVDNHPPLYSATESPEWKAFVARPSISLVSFFLIFMKNRKFADPENPARSDEGPWADPKSYGGQKHVGDFAPTRAGRLGKLHRHIGRKCRRGAQGKWRGAVSTNSKIIDFSKLLFHKLLGVWRQSK